MHVTNADRCYELSHGDDVFVDCTAYAVEGYHWCRVTHIAPGTASVYPIKFKVPGKGIGQCKASEVLGVRTQDWLVQTRAELRRLDMVRDSAERHVASPLTYRVVRVEDGDGEGWQVEYQEQGRNTWSTLPGRYDTIAAAEQYIADQR
jgi:hypothetical protein